MDEPGGGLAVSSLIDRLKKERTLELKVYTGNLSQNFVSYSNYKKLKSRLTPKEAEKILDQASPDILITGTGGGNAEQELRNAAYKKNLKSVVILDFWKDYKRRWLYAAYQIEKMNDIVCVMDKLTKKEMIKDGFPGKNLNVTGHPYLDEIFHNQTNSEKKIKTVKNNFLFLSQPLHAIGLTNYKIHPLKILLETLTAISKEKKEKFTMTVKLHPAEKLTDELSNIVGDFEDERLTVRFLKKNNKLNDLLERSDIIFGYNTIAMFEARALNKRTISLHVAEVRESLVKAMQTAGIERVDIKSKNNLTALLNAKGVKRSSRVFKGGIENCVQVILKELSLN